MRCLSCDKYYHTVQTGSYLEDDCKRELPVIAFTNLSKPVADPGFPRRGPNFRGVDENQLFGKFFFSEN